MTETRHKLGTGQEYLLAKNSYDAIGRVIKTEKGNIANLSQSYSYDVRSRLKNISNAFFTETLTYKLNSDIHTMQWVNSSQTRKYTYTYDKLSRLTASAYSSNIASEKYDTEYTYDKHGNMLTLKRYGKQSAGSYPLVDNLIMNYTGNRLMGVTELAGSVSLPESNDLKTSSTYGYNRNGAMKEDSGKNMVNISYNSLNLPAQLTVNGVTHTYTYAADGRKLKVVQGSDSRDYAGNLIYEKGSLKRVLVQGGYWEGGQYYFYVTDHLGNNRGVLDGAGNMIQQNHYYPFGMAFAETSAAEQNVQPYQYNGKELDRKNGLNLYDYSARYMDPALGRFTTPDPMAEKYYSISPYAYCANNPVRYVDPTGMVMSPYYDENGKFLGVDEDGFTGQIYITTQDAFNTSSVNGVADSKRIQGNSNTKKISTERLLLTPEAESNIYTDVMLKTEGVDFSKLYNGKVSVNIKNVMRSNNKTAKGINDPDYTERYSSSKTDDGQIKITAKSGAYSDEFSTVEGIQNYLGVHEYNAHGNKGYSDRNKTHWKAYELQMKHPTFKSLPPDLKKEVRDRTKKYMSEENKNQYNKYYGK